MKHTRMVFSAVSLLSFVFMVLISNNQVFAQCGSCFTERCALDTLIINTGYDHAVQNRYNEGELDLYWTVTGQPAGFGGTLPRPANTIAPYEEPPKPPSWGDPLADSRWLGAHIGAANVTKGAYTFERTFCLCDTTEAQLWMEILADDSAAVYLNGTYIGRSDPGSFFHPCTVSTNNTSLFRSCTNTIRVEVDNYGGVAMGLDIKGYITALNPGSLLSQLCCDTTSSIYGFKWHDINGDGIYQQNEGLMANWPINLSNEEITFTDEFGYYFFRNLPAGDYTVTETNPTGYVATFPTNGEHHITLHANEVVGPINFGNARTGSICGMKFYDIDGDGIKDPEDYGMDNWTINLSNGMSRITVLDGTYCFGDLPPGSYTVSEIPRIGWQQTCPPLNTYQITLVEGQTYTAINFGNQLISSCIQVPSGLVAW